MTALPAAYEPLDDTDRQGPFIVLEGVSGIGKSTLAALLARRMDGPSLHTLPTPHSKWSGQVNEGLRALPQFAFYLSGLLHASDRIRAALPLGTVIADRYRSSVAACHGAVHGIDPLDVAALLDAYGTYLAVPDHTFYLHCTPERLRQRLASKADVKQDDTDLFDVPDRHKQLVDNFTAMAATDPTAVVIDTSDLTPEEVADRILTRLEPSRA